MKEGTLFVMEDTIRNLTNLLPKLEGLIATHIPGKAMWTLVFLLQKASDFEAGYKLPNRRNFIRVIGKFHGILLYRKASTKETQNPFINQAGVGLLIDYCVSSDCSLSSQLLVRYSFKRDLGEQSFGEISIVSRRTDNSTHGSSRILLDLIFTIFILSRQQDRCDTRGERRRGVAKTDTVTIIFRFIHFEHLK